ncbi:hypothetical protein C1N32_05420 [Vibrio diazotrophicus]|uniref:Prepilin type IV endopeptidase peptidase domain-containing protein n=1 Tax=Vibrio diazotrophicus TaxID=685 RepID=A0A2J8I4U9_VIBDI|nr:hypothetical protein C1N32_05420 [Vibrio diazotrophicus]
MIYFAAFLSIINVLLSIKVMCSDFKSRMIKNEICILIFINNIILGYVKNSFPDNFTYVSFYAILIIIVWSKGYIGGGDAKLLISFLFSIESQYIIFAFCFMGIIGGSQLFIISIKNKFIKGIYFEHGYQVPYGIPISISFCVFSIL